MLNVDDVKSIKPRLFAIVMAAMLTIGVSANTQADVPFPGKLPVEVVSVEAANIIHINVETWPGFRRNIRIFLPDLVLPGQGPNPKECEAELAHLAYEFTVNFLENAEDIRVLDMWMENSASTDAISSIYTKNGTLDNALRRERLARPSDLAQNQPWC
ncbi:MAG: hypothetical protein H6937_01650 [Burkholderiales bacterium]|nr:hypothetical protein [Burkholderiales bacterium]MDR4517858.1 hypothetical protein [Nitrosomonas sp.]